MKLYVVSSFDPKVSSLAARLTRVGIDALKEEPRPPSFVYKVGKVLGHESILEHTVVSFVLQGVSRSLLELLEHHRLVSFAERSFRVSQKKLNYTPWFKEGDQPKWKDVLSKYFKLREEKVHPQDARAILPLAVATDVFVTVNFRELIYITKHLLAFPYSFPSKAMKDLNSDFVREVEEFTTLLLQAFSSLELEKFVFDENDEREKWWPWEENLDFVHPTISVNVPQIFPFLTSERRKEFVQINITGELSNAALAQLRRHRMNTLILESFGEDKKIYTWTMRDRRKFLWSGNLRQWEKVFALRSSPSAQQEIRNWVIQTNNFILEHLYN